MVLMKVGRVYFNFRNPTSLSTTIIVLNMQRASKFIHSSHTIENIFNFHCKDEVLVEIFKPPYPAADKISLFFIRKPPKNNG